MTHAFLYFLTMISARTAIIMLYLVVGLRLLGKRQIGQMNIYDLALVMALSNCVQNAMTHGNGNLSVGIVSATTLLVVGWIFTMLFIKIPKLEERVVGTPTLLLHDGRMDQARMRREHVTESELMSALRQHGVCDPSEALMAILEVDGSISIIPRATPHSRVRRPVKHGHGRPTK